MNTTYYRMHSGPILARQGEHSIARLSDSLRLDILALNNHQDEDPQIKRQQAENDFISYCRFLRNNCEQRVLAQREAKNPV